MSSQFDDVFSRVDDYEARLNKCANKRLVLSLGNLLNDWIESVMALDPVDRDVLVMHLDDIHMEALEHTGPHEGDVAFYDEDNDE